MLAAEYVRTRAEPGGRCSALCARRRAAVGYPPLVLRMRKAPLTEADSEPVGLPPYDAASAGGAKVIEAQGKRFGGGRRGRETKACAIARDVAHRAINQCRLIAKHDPGALEHRVSRKLASFFHRGFFLSLEP